MSRPPQKKVTRLSYCQYLLSSQTNYTLTHYAEHVEALSHDMINRYLRTEKLTARLIWEQVKPHIVPSKNGYVLFDDSVLDKNFSHKIESVRQQYSGNAHGIIKGIGLVNCVYVNPDTEQFWLVDYRLFDPERDGKSKIDHVEDMLKNLVNHKELPFSTVLMDTWYATNRLMLAVNKLEKLFYCPIKCNRLGRKRDSADSYQRIDALTWTEEEEQQGKEIQLRRLPQVFKVKLFRVTVSTRRRDYVLTNDPSQACADDTRKVCAIRWLIEQFHREVKQLTGIERCECRKQRIQRNHIACAALVWVRFKVMAYETKETVYQIKQNLLRDYLIQELKAPRVDMLGFA